MPAHQGCSNDLVILHCGKSRCSALTTMPSQPSCQVDAMPAHLCCSLALLASWGFSNSITSVVASRRLQATGARQHSLGLHQIRESTLSLGSSLWTRRPLHISSRSSNTSLVSVTIFRTAFHDLQPQQKVVKIFLKSFQTSLRPDCLQEM